MAERQQSGKYFFLYRGNGEVSNETFDVFACVEGKSISQSVSEITAETSCGVISLPGSASREVPWSLIPTLGAGSSIVPIDTLQDDLDDGSFHNYKIAPATPASGDPVFAFRGFMRELNWDFQSADFFKADGVIKVDDDGIGMTITA